MADDPLVARNHSNITTYRMLFRVLSRGRSILKLRRCTIRDFGASIHAPTLGALIQSDSPTFPRRMELLRDMQRSTPWHALEQKSASTADSIFEQLLRLQGVPSTATLGTKGDPLGLKNSSPFDFPNRLVDPGCQSLINPATPYNYIKTQCFAPPTVPVSFAAQCIWILRCCHASAKRSGILFESARQCRSRTRDVELRFFPLQKQLQPSDFGELQCPVPGGGF